VYDPFVGSGTTALSALSLGRRYIGSEINEDYYKISLDRIKQMEEQGTLFAQ
jgi:DNA modification methylase